MKTTEDKERGQTARVPGDGDDVDETPFKDLPPLVKFKSVTIVVVKFCLIFACLYVFICSLGLLESAFQLVGGKTAGKAFSSGVLSNPLAGLMIGVLSTVLIQSSSSTTSIVITMVASDVIPLDKAVPIVMGANIGTSVTNTLVSLAQAGNRAEFRRAFAGATVHDMFNWITVLVLLPVEIVTGYLVWLTGLIVDTMELNSSNEKSPDMLKALTKPFLNAIVKVNEEIIKEVAHGANNTEGSVLKRWCKTEEVTVTQHTPQFQTQYINCSQLGEGSLLHSVCNKVKVSSENLSVTFEWELSKQVNITRDLERCDNLFAQTDLSDTGVGVILLILALTVMLSALMFIVKILQSMLDGSISKVIKRTINADLPGRFAYFTGYLAILVGCGVTMVVQSSSVFTSTLTPLVGLGIVDIERMYPMTVGANIGTTVTGVMAALSQSGDKLEHALQLSLCHCFFNITGLLIFYPIPFMRVPIGMAKVLGKTTSKHRWFAIFYIVLMFVILPGTTFALSYAGWIYLGAIGGPILFIFLVIVAVNAFQKKRPQMLPKKLRNWDFLPEWMHSLKPVDRLIAKVFRCAYCQELQKLSVATELVNDYEDEETHVETSAGNPVFDLEEVESPTISNGLLEWSKSGVVGTGSNQFPDTNTHF